MKFPGKVAGEQAALTAAGCGVTRHRMH